MRVCFVHHAMLNSQRLSAGSRLCAFEMQNHRWGGGGALSAMLTFNPHLVAKAADCATLSVHSMQASSSLGFYLPILLD